MWLLENRKKGVSSVLIKITSISAKSWTAEKDSEIFVFWLTDILNLREQFNIYTMRYRILQVLRFLTYKDVLSE